MKLTPDWGGGGQMDLKVLNLMVLSKPLEHPQKVFADTTFKQNFLVRRRDKGREGFDSCTCEYLHKSQKIKRTAST